MVEPGDYPTIRDLFGERVVPPDPEKSDSYPLRGALDTMFGRALPKAEIFAVTQEFGTSSRGTSNSNAPLVYQTVRSVVERI